MKNSSFNPKEVAFKSFMKTVERSSKINFEEYIKRMDLVEYLENTAIQALAVILVNGFNPEELYLPTTIAKKDRLELEEYLYKIKDNLEKVMLRDFHSVLEPLIGVIRHGKETEFKDNKEDILNTIYSILLDSNVGRKEKPVGNTQKIYDIYLLEVCNTFRKHIDNIAYIMFPKNLSPECINTFLIHTTNRNELSPLYLFIMNIIYLRLLRNKNKLALPFLSKDNRIVNMYLDTQDFKYKLDMYISHYLIVNNNEDEFSFVNYIHLSKNVIFSSFETLNLFMKYVKENITYRELKFMETNELKVMDLYISDDTSDMEVRKATRYELLESIINNRRNVLDNKGKLIKIKSNNVFIKEFSYPDTTEKLLIRYIDKNKSVSLYILDYVNKTFISSVVSEKDYKSSVMPEYMFDIIDIISPLLLEAISLDYNESAKSNTVSDKEVDDYIKLTQDVHINGYIRKLPNGQSASQDNRYLAKRIGLVLEDDYTYVRPHIKKHKLSSKQKEFNIYEYLAKLSK